MVKISEMVNQNPWWKHEENFAFDKNLKEAREKLIFSKRKKRDSRKTSAVAVLLQPNASHRD